MKLSTALNNASRAALQWRLLVIWLASTLLPALLFALPLWQTLSPLFDKSIHAPELARALDLVAIADIMNAVKTNVVALQSGGMAALVLALLLSPFLTGVIVTAGRAQEVARFGELLAGGVREYPRMFRMLLWAVVPLGVALALGGALADAASEATAEAVLEADAERAALAATIGAAVLLALANLTLDAGRAQLAIDRRRSSAVKAWWWGLQLLLRRPGAMLGGYALLTVAGLALAALLAVARINLPGGTTFALVAAFLLTQLLALSVAWMRAARLLALMSVAAANRR